MTESTRPRDHGPIAVQSTACGDQQFQLYMAIVQALITRHGLTATTFDKAKIAALKALAIYRAPMRAKVQREVSP